jgi:hypothetical protein
MPKENKRMMTSDDRIQGKVAAILSLSELIINRGSLDGVESGMQFAVLNSHGINVKDPETGKVLGSAEIVKTLVKIVRIDGDHLSVGRTFRTIRGRRGAMDTLKLATAMGLTGTPDRIETLATSEATLKQELSEEESLVKIGDPVIQAKGDEYENA